LADNGQDGRAAARAAGRAPGRASGVALLSAAVLLLQLVQTRIFSVMLWHHLTYLVVTFTMLGFAAGGTLLACRRSLLGGDVSRRLAWLALVFAAAVLGAYALLTRALPEAAHSGAGIATAALDYAVLLVPMIFAGMAVALVLADAGEKVGRMYAFNMGGSALGCALYVPMLRSLGAEGAVLAAGALAAAGAWCFAQRGTLPGSSRTGGGALAWLAGAVALSLTMLAALAPTAVFSVPLAASKAMAQQLAHDPTLRVEASQWDPLCRIDVIGPGADAPTAVRTIFQDGDASTVLPYGDAERDVNIFDKEGLAYLLFPDRAPKVLAIGIGGGIDVIQAAAEHRPLPNGQRVDFTGIEINPTTVGLMRGAYRGFSGDRYELPGVRVLLDEGRSWLRRSSERYDIIQMTGTDTYAALSNGSYVMSESYLYTAEAYDDFLAHLTEDGVISVLRFRFDPPREVLRLAAIAVDALRRDGATDPADHVVMLGFDGNKQEVDGRLVGMDFGALLFRKRPFTPAEVSIYTRYADRLERVHVMHAPGAAASGGSAAHGADHRADLGAGPVADYFAAVRAGTDAAFRAAYVYNLDPVTDDNPFFFRYDRWDAALARWFGVAAGDAQGDDARLKYTGIVGGEPIGLIMLGTVFGESLLLVALLVLVPLWLFRREGLATPGARRWMLYFMGLGAGYMLLEIVAMQRFVLFLGNPGYALTVVLVTFLFFSGVGAAVAGRAADPRRTLTASLCVVLVMVAVLGAFLPGFFESTLRLALPWRIALSVSVLAPLAFVMGMPFPSGLALVSRERASLVPWAFGVNGGASVLASVIAVLVAMAAGFSVVFVCAGAAYLVALLAGRGART
jgi:hypothetical protein